MEKTNKPNSKLATLLRPSTAFVPGKYTKSRKFDYLYKNIKLTPRKKDDKKDEENKEETKVQSVRPQRVNIPKFKRYKKTVLPPFKNLQSFHCSAVILSYYDYRIEVRALMKSLCRNSRAYYVKHRTILTGHLIPFPRKSPIFNE